MLRIIIIILWLFLGVFYWYAFSDRCCDTKDERTPEKQNLNEIVVSKPILKTIKRTPLLFECSGIEPRLQEKWSLYKDSLVTNLADNQILQIKGLGYNNEVQMNPDIGLKRAKAIKMLFNLPEEKIKLISQLEPKNCEAEPFMNFITFKSLIQTTKIKEVDDRTIIYFKFNSIDKLNDNEVELYLDDVAKRVIQTNENLILVGHTDNSGEEEKNLSLGQGRADVIKNYLTLKGVPSDKISSSSKGESMPIQSNDSETGRAKNRRVELQIR